MTERQGALSGARGWAATASSRTTRKARTGWGNPATCARVHKGPDPRGPVTLSVWTVATPPFDPTGGARPRSGRPRPGFGPARSGPLSRHSGRTLRARNERVRRSRRRSATTSCTTAATSTPSPMATYTMCRTSPGAPTAPTRSPPTVVGSCPTRQTSRRLGAASNALANLRASPTKSCVDRPLILLERACRHQVSTWGRRLADRARHPGPGRGQGDDEAVTGVGR